MKTVVGIIAVLVTAWLQVSLFGHLRPLGVMPHLMLVAIVLFGLWSNATPTMAAAVGGGWLLDTVAADHNFGLRTAFYIVVALAVIAGRQLGIQADSVYSGALIITLGTLIFDGIVLATIGAPLSLGVAGTVGRELIVNLIGMGLIYIVRANVRGRQRTTLEFRTGLKS